MESSCWILGDRGDRPQFELDGCEHAGRGVAPLAVGGRFRLQFGNPSSGDHELSPVLAGRPGQLPGVDEVLTSPDVDRLLADAETVSDLPDRPAGIDEIEDLAPELGRVTTGR
nr:hypothetical protein [Streptomyces sp. CB02400]